MSLLGSAANDTLVGNGLANTLTGGDGNDTLRGGGDSDTLIGGAGNDLLIGGDWTDTYLFSAGFGQDIIDDVISGSDFAQDKLIFDATIAPDMVNVMRSGSDVLLKIEGTSDVITLRAITRRRRTVSRSSSSPMEPCGTRTTWPSSSPRFMAPKMADELTVNAQSTILKGLGGNDILHGSAAYDTLDGGSGADTMDGAGGNDTYVVDNALDTVIENPGAGTDTVRSSITWTLSANVEVLQLTGSANINGTGNNDVNGNRLYGNAGANILTGGIGADWFRTGGGSDTLIGGAGDDMYELVGGTGATATIVEIAGEGMDVVQTDTDGYVLSANVENLFLLGSAITGKGNEGDNYIVGTTGANMLYGFGGNDVFEATAGTNTMYGGAGDDVYYINRTLSGTNTINEVAGEGTDWVYMFTTSTFTYTLPAEVENAVSSSEASSISFTGNSLSNALYGDDGNNTLNGQGWHRRAHGLRRQRHLCRRERSGHRCGTGG